MNLLACSRRTLVVGTLAGIFTLCSPLPAAGESDYRRALKRYWKDTVAEQGLTPTFFASSFHSPRTVLFRKGSTVDYFSSGLDLFPESCVEVVTAPIVLPTRRVERSLSVGLALQFAAVPEASIADASLDALVRSNTEWEMTFSESELQFLPLRDARKCLKYRTSEMLQKEYINLLGPGEDLCVIAKAVMVHDGNVTVKAAGGVDAELGAEITEILEKVGFKISTDKKSASTVRFKDMYYAVACRQLTKDGLKSSAGDDAEPAWVELDLPAALPVDATND